MSKVFEDVVNSKVYDKNVEQYDSVIDMFLSRYFICETFAKELQKTEIYYHNKDEVKKQFKKDIGKELTSESIEKMLENLDMSKLKVYEEKNNNINVGSLKRIVPNDKFNETDINMIFHSKQIEKSKEVKIKTARILRNEIVHSLNESAMNEVKTRSDELINLMIRFIDLFSSKK